MLPLPIFYIFGLIMEWMSIKKDNQRTRKLFLHYHHHEWKKRFRKQKIWFVVLPVALVLFIIGYTRSLHDYNSFFLTSVSFVVLMYLPMLYCLQMARLFRSLKKVTAETPAEFQFRFDKEGTFYQTPGVFEHQKWSSFKYYSLNKSEVYLYNHEGYVRQIIAETMIGPAHFNEALDIIKSQLVPKYR